MRSVTRVEILTTAELQALGDRFRNRWRFTPAGSRWSTLLLVWAPVSVL